MKVVSFLLAKLSSLAILSAFGAIGFWGHRTHWQFTGPHDHNISEVAAVTDNGESQHPAPLQNAPKVQDRVALDAIRELKDSGIELHPAKLEPVREVIPAIATVTYNGQRYSQLSTRADGHVLHVFVRVGQTVRKGEVLALVDSQAVGEAKSSWLQAAATAHYQQRLLQKLIDIEHGAIPQSRIRAVEAEVRQAELATIIAQQRLANLGFLVDGDLNLDKSPKELSEQIRFLGVPKEILGRLATQPSTANLIAIKAPFDGVVVEQHAVDGEMVTTTDYQFIVADTSTMWVKLSVQREDASKLSVGQEVEFVADGIEATIRTKLAWIDPEIDAESQTIQAGCEVSNDLAGISGDEPGHRVLQANQFGTASICVAKRSNAILVPEASIQRMPDQSIIAFVGDRDNLVFERRMIQVGVRQNGLIEVLDGIHAGEMVVSEGSFILKSELMRASLVGG